MDAFKLGLLTMALLCVAGIARAEAVQVTGADAFLAAIEGDKKEIEITKSFTVAHQKSGLSATLIDGSDNFIPILIPDGTRIYSADPATYTISFRMPVQLAGDVTFENVGVQLTNTNDYQRTLFLAGYTLTLKKIRNTGDAIDLYAGGYAFEKDAPTVGSAAKLVIDAPNAGSTGSPNPNLGTVYLSSTTRSTYLPYSGTAEMTLSQKTLIGTVHAEGATVTVERESSGGLSASTTNYITDATTTLTLGAGVEQTLTKGTFGEVVVPSGTTLYLYNLSAEVTLHRLTGGGTLVRDAAGNVTIGNYTGTTAVRCSAPAEDVALLETAQVPTATDGFTLDSTTAKKGYELNYRRGVLWLTTGYYRLRVF